MPLFLFFRPSFERSLKALGATQTKTIALILEVLEIYYSSDCDLDKARQLVPGFFYKQLRKPYYEAGIESNLRIVLMRHGNQCVAVLAGNHDQIRKFLNNQ